MITMSKKAVPIRRCVSRFPVARYGGVGTSYLGHARAPLQAQNTWKAERAPVDLDKIKPGEASTCAGAGEPTPSCFITMEKGRKRARPQALQLLDSKFGSDNMLVFVETVSFPLRRNESPDQHPDQ
eukprot:2985872-Rhodomonas_salina.3